VFFREEKATNGKQKHKKPKYKQAEKAFVFLFSDKVKAIPKPYQVQVK
jgi:hypothetical protein